VQSLKGRVLVPTATWKAIYDPVARGAGAYMCPNVSHPDCTTLSIAALSRAIGLDPFPWVPNTVKRTAMQLPAPEPSRYGSTGQRGRHPQQRQGLFDWLRKRGGLP
jgi:endonuclease G, mitochondrial